MFVIWIILILFLSLLVAMGVAFASQNEGQTVESNNTIFKMSYLVSALLMFSFWGYKSYVGPSASPVSNAPEETYSAEPPPYSPPETAPIPTGSAPTNPQAENTVKAFINLNGQLCAEIVSVRPLAMPDTAEVTCIEYRGGSVKVTYIINIKTGELQKAG